MVRENHNRNLWILIAFVGIIIPYILFLYPYPTKASFSDIEDIAERNAAYLLMLDSWYWSLAIVSLSSISAFMAIRSWKGWRLLTCITVLLLFIFQDFPFTIYGLLTFGVNSFNEFINRVSFFMGYPSHFYTIITFDILVPLLGCLILIFVILDILRSRKNIRLSEQLQAEGFNDTQTGR